MLPIRSEHSQNTKLSRSRHWKWSWLADDDLPPSPEKKKKISKPKHTRLKFDLEKLNDSNVLETFQAMIGEKYAPLTIMNNEDVDLDSLITAFNTAVTEIASEILGKHRQKKNPGSLQKFLICATEGEDRERNDMNRKALGNTRKWTATSRSAW